MATGADTLERPSGDPLARRRSLVLIGVLAALAAAAWLGSLDQMQGMVASSRFDGGGIGFFVALWVVMMAAMMFPSVWPTVTIHQRVMRRRAQAGRALPGRTTAFVSGYLAAWTLYGLAAYGLFLLAQTAGLDTLNDVEANRYVLAPVALVAAAYQAVPFKQACLRHCRNPIFWLMDNWREGIGGSTWLGVRHGAYCVGCCWMLMLVLLALGFMSVTWMAVAAGAIALEKLAPRRYARSASVLLAAGFLALGVVAIAWPDLLPGMMSMAPGDSMSPGSSMSP